MNINKKSIKAATISAFLVFFSFFLKTNSLINTHKNGKNTAQSKVTTTKKIDALKNYSYKLLLKTKRKNLKEKSINNLLPEVSKQEVDLSSKVKTPHKKHERNIFETLACIFFIFLLAICFLVSILLNLKIPTGLNASKKSKYKKIINNYKN